MISESIGLAPLLVVDAVLNDADGQSEKLVEPAHPFRVALGQVVVDGDDVNALAFERIQIGRQRGDQRLSFTGLHFRDPALMQNDTADELHVEMPHVQDALAGFANDCEGFRKQVVQRLAVCEALPEFCGFGLKVGIRERRDARFERVDLGDDWSYFFEFAVVAAAKYLADDSIEHIRVYRRPVGI